MSDTTTTTTTTEEPEFPETVELEADIPDGNLDAFIKSIKVTPDSNDAAPRAVYESVAEHRKAHKLTEDGGVWVPVKCYPEGTEIQIGSLRDALKRKRPLERQFREANAKYGYLKKNGKGEFKRELSDDEANDVFLAAIFGTAIKGWRGPAFEGEPFTLENWAGEDGIAKLPAFAAEFNEIFENADKTALEALRGN